MNLYGKNEFVGIAVDRIHDPQQFRAFYAKKTIFRIVATVVLSFEKFSVSYKKEFYLSDVASTLELIIKTNELSTKMKR